MNNPCTHLSPRVLAIGGLVAPICGGLVALPLLDNATQAQQEETRQEISVVLVGNVSRDDQGELRRALELVRQHEERLRLKTGQDFHFSISIDGKLLATGPYGESGSSTTVPLEESKDQK